MTHISQRLGISITRLGEYLRRFGAAGAWLSLEHQVKFRLSRRTAPRSTMIPGLGRVLFRPRSSDLATFREIFVNRDYDLEAHGILDLARTRYGAICRRGGSPLILDLGANIGLATLQFKQFFPEADVIAVEPGKDNIELARRTLKGKLNIRFVHAAIWDKEPIVQLTDGCDQSSRHVRTGEEAGVESVPAITVEKIVGGREADLFLVKIDVEGAEARIFGKDDVSKGWLSGVPAIIIEGHDGSHNRHGSLSGLLQHENYRNGRITSAGPALVLVPIEWFGDVGAR